MKRRGKRNNADRRQRTRSSKKTESKLQPPVIALLEDEGQTRGTSAATSHSISLRRIEEDDDDQG